MVSTYTRTRSSIQQTYRPIRYDDSRDASRTDSFFEGSVCAPGGQILRTGLRMSPLH